VASPPTIDVDRRVSLNRLADIAERLQAVTHDLRDRILAPRPRKSSPVFTSTQLAALCQIDRNRYTYLLSKLEEFGLPGGTLLNSRQRGFTLQEVRVWIQKTSPLEPSPLTLGKPTAAKIIAVANFKGGSTKTTTAMNLAQGLTLRGRKVLVVDLDPQASLTELCGFYAEKDLTDDDTVLPYIDSGDTQDLRRVVQGTYWDGLDLIPAHTYLFNAEFLLPAKVLNSPGFFFWNVLRDGLDSLRADYDYIVLDSAPALSYLTINALMAADALVMPLVPESLDFMSSVSFWSLFSDMSRNYAERGDQKVYDFISVLLSRVDYTPSSAAPVVRNWATRAYEDWVSEVEIPASSVASATGLTLGTVHDLSKGDAPEKSLARVKEPLTAYCRWLDEQYTEHWRALK
jgi:chromosome partitioning protein